MNQRPNILLLCPDEMKASTLGLYGQRQPVSPFLDKLAKDAAVFEQCHTVHPKCVPSRTAFLTSQYPHVGGHRTLQLLVRPHEINLVRELRAHGYQTALFGKNHVVEDATLPQTFDVFKPDGGKYTLERQGDDERGLRGSYWVGQDPVPLAEWRDTLNTDNALRWLHEERDQARPFFAWLNWDSPHPPYKVPAPFYGKLDRSSIELPPLDDFAGQPAYLRRLHDTYRLRNMSAADWQELIATYLEMVRFIDAEVKRVFRRLDELGLSENTIVAFWSDHGDFAGEHQLVEKWDTSFYDCITRVPLLLWGPRHVRPLRTGALVESIDLLPTLLDLCDVPVPRGIQGRSLRPVLSGESTEHRDLVFCQGGQEIEMFDRVVPPNARPRPCVAYQLKQQAFYDEPNINARAKMIRSKEWKYVWRLIGPEELYHFVSDPHELSNLAGKPEFQAVVQEWRMKLLRKLVEAETVEPHQSFVES